MIDTTETENKNRNEVKKKGKENGGKIQQ